MPYRRSRLQDYYEQLLGGKPEEPESEEPKQDLPPYIYPSVPPRPQPAPPPIPQPQPESPHKYADQPVSQPSAQPTPPAEQSTGQEASSSESSERGSKDSSQSGDVSDADHGNDGTGAQEVLRDIAEVEDEFGTDRLVDSISWDRLYRYSNLDVFRVQQDIQRRPLIFQHCFQHSASRQDAMECIYAFPPDFDENELRHLEQVAKEESEIRSGMADEGTGDARNDVEEAFTLDDVRQFTEIDTETTDPKKATDYEEMLEAVFGYEIEFNDEEYNYSDEEKIRQLQNLAKANVHIIDYLEDVFVDDDDRSGLSVFKQYFSKSEYGQLKVSLGDNIITGGVALGLVPLPESTTENLEMMFLGSHVDIPAIVHEFGHVISRSVGIASMYDAAESTFRNTWNYQTGVGMNLMIYTNSIVGLAARQRSTHEVWADIFMTAVLDPLVTGIHPPYTLLSVKKEDIYDLPFEGFFDCEDIDNECVVRQVQWRRNPDGSLWNNADAVRRHVGEILLGLPLLKNGGDFND